MMRRDRIVSTADMKKLSDNTTEVKIFGKNTKSFLSRNYHVKYIFIYDISDWYNHYLHIIILLLWQKI